jgi:hypothetical protein
MATSTGVQVPFWRHWNSVGRQTLLCLCLLVGVSTTGAKEINIAPYCKVWSTPYMGAAIANLTDGKIASPADGTLMLAAPLGPRIGETSLQYEFAFPGPLVVTGVRLFQSDSRDRMPATVYVIEIDSKGNGRYEKRVAVENRGRGGEWVAYPVSPPIAGYGLRFRAIPSVGNIGSNYGPPAIEEFEILTEGDPPRLPRRTLPDAPLLEEDTARAATLRIEAPSEAVAPSQASFRRGLFGSMWAYWSPGQDYSEQGNEGKLALLRRLKVNRYWLYPGAYVPRRTDLPYLTLPHDPDYLHFVDRQLAWRLTSQSKEMRILPFPSQIVPGYRENVLRRFVSQMHNGGVRVIVNELMLPYGLKSWDFPRVADPYIYPSVLSSSFVREASTTLYTEFMQAGVDGLALGGDEFFLRDTPGIDEDVSPICRDVRGWPRDICKPTTIELFRQRFGRDVDPLSRTFSPAAAKWKVFQYEQLAGLFAHYAEMMKSVDPNAIVTSLFRSGEENRPHFGIAYDVMGLLGGVAEMSSNPYWSHNSYLGHYFFANEAKRLQGASRSRTAAITLQTTPRFDRDGYEDPLMVYGPAFSGLMHGVKGINFYKEGYLFAGGRNDAGPWVEKFFNLTAFLEGKGLRDYHVPKSVALLYSRASEDWWQLSHATNPVEAPQAMVYQNAVMEVLFRDGIPFDLYYLDQPSSLEKLGDYRMAILAYPYSIPKGGVDQIRKAMTSGTKVLALWRAGEVDEYGAAYPTPLLRDVPGVERLTIDLTRSDYAGFSGRLVPELHKSLGGETPLSLDAAGHDVECSVMEKGDSRMLFCLNWEKQPADVNLGVSLPEGRYGASLVTMEQESPARIGGRYALSPADLGKFRLALAPGEARVVVITPLAGAPAPSK